MDQIKQDIVSEVISKLGSVSRIFEIDPNASISVTKASEIFAIPNVEIIRDILIDHEIKSDFVPARGGKTAQIFRYGDFAAALIKERGGSLSIKYQKYAKKKEKRTATDSPTQGGYLLGRSKPRKTK